MPSMGGPNDPTNRTKSADELARELVAAQRAFPVHKKYAVADNTGSEERLLTGELLEVFRGGDFEIRGRLLMKKEWNSHWDQLSEQYVLTAPIALLKKLEP